MKHDAELKAIANKLFEARDLAQKATDLLHAIVQRDDFRTKFDKKFQDEVISARQSAALVVAHLDDNGPCDDFCQYL